MSISTNRKTWPLRVRSMSAALLFLAAYSVSIIAPFVPARSASAHQNSSHEVVCHREGNGTSHPIPPNQQSAHIPNHVDLSNLGHSDFIIYAEYPANADWNDLKDTLDAKCASEDPAPPKNVTAPTYVDVCGVRDDKYIIPTDPYATYKVNGTVKPAGTYAATGSVTITAVPKAYSFTYGGQTYTWDYVLIPPTSWVFNFTDVPCTGSITIVKDALPNSTQDFGFSANGTGVSSFTLDDDSGVPGASATRSNTKTFSNLLPGTYVFTENPDGDEWDLTSLSCTGTTSAVTSLPSKKVTITLSAGQNVTCTFVNTQQGKGKIIVKKETLPDGSKTDFKFKTDYSSDFYLSDGEANYSGWMKAGTYNVSEVVPAGWAQQSATCDDGSPVSAISVSAGEVVTCTFTNTKLAKLIIKKYVKYNDSQDFAFTTSANLSGFSLDDDGYNSNPLSDTKYLDNLVPGQAYTVTESELAGWTLTNLECSGGASVDLQARTISFTPTADSTATCTFTNTKLASISGVKWNDLDGDGKWDAGEPTLDGWTINLTGKTDSGQTVNMTYVTGSGAAGTGAYSFGYLLPGTYTITETPQANWVQTSVNPLPVVLKAGQTVSSINFGNRGQGKLTVIKKFAPYYDNGKVNLLVDGDIKATNVGHNGSTGVVTVWAGSHNISETAGHYTDLSKYTATWSCSNEQSGSGMVITGVMVNAGDHITCTFTNMRKTGTITVIKNVDNGYGHVTKDVKNWTWSYDGPKDENGISTGSNNTQIVPVGTYTVKENQKDGYHVVKSSCRDDSYYGPYGYDTRSFGGGYDWPSTSETVTVEAGKNIICEFTNKRDTGSLTVHKKIGEKLNPWGWKWWLSNPWNVQSMGDTEKVTTGWYWFGEHQKDGYSFENLKCKVDGKYIPVRQDVTAGVYVGKNDNVVCTFTNSRDTGDLTIVKDALPDGLQPFHFTIESVKYDEPDDEVNQSYNSEQSNLEFVYQNSQSFSDNQLFSQPEKKKGLWDWGHSAGIKQTFDLVDSSDEAPTREKTLSLPTGWYRVQEASVEGWDQVDVSCGETEWKIGEDGKLYVYVDKHAEITCTFTNEKRAQLTIVKDAKPNVPKSFSFTSTLPGELGEDAAFSLTDDGTGLANSKVFANLKAGTYTVTEAAMDAWKLDDIVCTGSGVTMKRDGMKLTVTLAVGAEASCTFVNSFVPQVLGDESPQLLNTGTSNALATVVALLLTISAVLVVVRRQQYQA